MFNHSCYFLFFERITHVIDLGLLGLGLLKLMLIKVSLKIQLILALVVYSRINIVSRCIMNMNRVIGIYGMM